MLPAVSTQSLPGLVQRAASQLASATSAAEVLDARDAASIAYDAAKKAARLAKAKGAHDELIAKAHRAQADALEIEAMAKRRLADEYDAAQLRGEVASGRPKSIPDENTFVATVADIGLSSKDIHEARQIRDAEETYPGIVRRTLDAALDAGEEPTKAAVNRAVSKRSAPRRKLSAAGKQLANLRKAWREACPAVRQHFLAEVTERIAA
jgi:hypothetical protein